MPLVGGVMANSMRAAGAAANEADTFDITLGEPDVNDIMASANPAAAEEPASASGSSSEDGAASDDTAAGNGMATSTLGVDVGSADKPGLDGESVNKTVASTVAPSPQDPEQPLEDNLINWGELPHHSNIGGEELITSFQLPASLPDVSEQ